MTGPSVDVDRYLERIGFRATPTVDLDTLEALMRAHLSTVPFENLDVFNRTGVRTDLDWSSSKVLDQGRGGWCFELNGLFGTLLQALGFNVARIGAAVLLGGPATLVDHLTLEVTLEEPYLVDVGFGDGFCRPLALNRRGPQDGGTGDFEFMQSPQGTTLTRLVDDVPAALYRFKRVSLALADFDRASHRLQTDPEEPFHTRAFATRHLDGGPDRVTLIGNQLKLQRSGEVTETDVADEDWVDTLEQWFGFRIEPAGPPDRLAKDTPLV